MILQTPSLFIDAAAKAGIPILKTISVSDAVNICCLLHMPMSAFRNLRRILTNLGTNIFLSEPKMRHEQRRLAGHVNDQSVEVKFEPLKLKKDDDKLTHVPVMRVRDLPDYIAKVYNDLKAAGKIRFDGIFRDAIWVVVGGDKGGDHTKFHFEILNSTESGSVYEVHLFSMYEGADFSENIATVLYPYPFREQFWRLNLSVVIDGHKIDLFLGGDFKFLDACMGHQGSTSTHPIFYDDITLSHLQNHGGRPHTKAP